MRSRHSVEEKFEIVMEVLTENTTQAEICRMHGTYLRPFVLLQYYFQFIQELPLLLRVFLMRVGTV